jgi:hypothetical protein
MAFSTHKLSIALFFATATSLLSCATTGPGDKKSPVIIPTSQEVAIGAGMAKEVEETQKALYCHLNASAPAMNKRMACIITQSSL